MMKKMLIAVSAITLLMTGMAYAQAKPPVSDQPQMNQKQHLDIDQRLIHQRQRIDQGIARKTLTEQEVTLLNKEEEEIKRMVAEAKSDGVVTKEEKAKIMAALDHASSNIKGEKHDAEKSSIAKKKPVAKEKSPE
jgi:uncharacterized membrane protein YebE (DUF533 family)